MLLPRFLRVVAYVASVVVLLIWNEQSYAGDCAKNGFPNFERVCDSGHLNVCKVLQSKEPPSSSPPSETIVEVNCHSRAGDFKGNFAIQLQSACQQDSRKIRRDFHQQHFDAQSRGRIISKGPKSAAYTRDIYCMHESTHIPSSTRNPSRSNPSPRDLKKREREWKH